MARSQVDLGITAAVAGFACIAAAVNAPVAITTVLGVVLFAAPGYLLCQLLFGSQVSGLERVVVSAGLALCVPILGGLLLYLARVPLHRTAWLGLLAGVTLASDLVLLLRRLLRRGSNAPLLEKKREDWDLPMRHVIAFGAAAVIAVCALLLASFGAARQHYPGFTQLWLVHRDQNAATANLGVANHEGRTTRYKLVLLHNKRIADTWNLDIPNGQSWQQTTQFSEDYSITARLYRLPDLSTAYRYVAIGANRDGL